MIDINELRLLVQDFKLVGSPVFVQAADMDELLDRIEKAEKERDALRAALRHEADCVEAAAAKIEALVAKIVEMERQELVAEWVETRFDGAKLYKLYVFPGAKGE